MSDPVKNRDGNPIREPPKAGEDIAGRTWTKWFRDLWRVVSATQRLTPSVVVRSVTASYQSEPGEQVLCDPTAGAFGVLLPVTGGKEHKQVDIKNDSDSTNDVTVSGVDSDGDIATIDGANSFSLSAREDITCIEVPSEDRWVIR